MKKKLLLMLLSMSIAFTGCGKANSEDDTDTASTDQVEVSETTEAKENETSSENQEETDQAVSEPGVFTIAIDYMPASLQSALGSDSQTVMTRPIYDTLFEETVDGIMYRLAEDLNISDDGLVYTIHLNKDANWSDGEPITSQDIVFSFDYEEQVMGMSTKKQVDGEPIDIKVIDDKTLEMTLPKPSLSYVYDLAMANILPSHPFDNDPSKVDGSDYFLTPGMATSGAYTVEEVNADSFVFKARDDYYRGKPQVETIVLKLLGSGSTRNIAMENKEISYCRITSGEQLEKYKSQPDLYNIESVSEGRVNYLHINPRSPIFDRLKDPLKARQAIFMALDQDEIIMAAYGSPELAIPANSVLCPDQELYNPEGKAYEQNIEEAKKLAEESGLVNEKLRYVYNKDRVNMEQIATIIQQELSNIGVDIEIQGLDNAGFWGVFGGFGDGEWELATNGQDTMRGRSLGSFGGPWWMDSEIWGWSQEVIDLANEINTEVNADKRQELANELQEKTIEECWFYPLPYPQFVTASPANVFVGNVPIVPEFGDYLQIEVK